MSEEAQRRVARNQARFRETNEAIERGQWPGEPAKVLRFRCECSQMDCGDAVEMPIVLYEHVHAHPRRFLVAEGHIDPSVQDVAAHGKGYLVVEKRGTAGQVAEASDPRA